METRTWIKISMQHMCHDDKDDDEGADADDDDEEEEEEEEENNYHLDAGMFPMMIL